MADYKAPINEVSFVLNDLLNINSLTQIPDFAEATPELVSAVVEEAGKFAADVFAPINRVGDVEHSRAANGEVTSAPGFKEAYQHFVENGWLSLACRSTPTKAICISREKAGTAIAALCM